MWEGSDLVRRDVIREHLVTRKGNPGTGVDRSCVRNAHLTDNLNTVKGRDLSDIRGILRNKRKRVVT